MAKKILKVDYDYEFLLIGIISSLKDYRLAHFINKQLDFDFKRQDQELKYRNTGLGRECSASIYAYSIEESESCYFFFPNKGSDGYIIPESRETDFFLINTETNTKILTQDLLKKLNNIERIERAFQIDPIKLKSRENLLFF